MGTFLKYSINIVSRFSCSLWTISGKLNAGVYALCVGSRLSKPVRKTVESASESHVPYDVLSSATVQHVRGTVLFPTCCDSQPTHHMYSMPSPTPERGVYADQVRVRFLT